MLTLEATEYKDSEHVFQNQASRLQIPVLLLTKCMNLDELTYLSLKFPHL